MKRILTALVLLTGLFGAGGAVWAGDFDKGIKAWGRHDYATALKEWRSLAEQGNARAQFGLGFLYYYGKGVTQDKTEALKWYRKAAEGGGMQRRSNGSCACTQKATSSPRTMLKR